MKKKITALVFLAWLLASSACRSPIVRESEVPGQTRFEQEQAGYPDRLSRQQEADAAERTRKEDMVKEP